MGIWPVGVYDYNSQIVRFMEYKLTNLCLLNMNDLVAMGEKTTHTKQERKTSIDDFENWWALDPLIIVNGSICRSKVMSHMMETGLWIGTIP